MAQELTKANGDAARLYARVGTLYAAIKRDDRRRCDTLPALISTEDRKQLDEYRKNLHARLQPISLSVADKNRALSAIGLFLGGYLNVRTTDPQGTANSYLAMLSGEPLFAILAALDDFTNRRVVEHYDANDNPVYFTLDHAPSAPRILDQAKKHSGEVYEERYRVTRLLSVERVSEPEVSEVERERVGTHMRVLADSLIVGSSRIRAQEQEKTREEAEAARARAKRIVQEAAARRRSAAQAEAGQ